MLVPAYNEEAVLNWTLSAATREAGAENVYIADDCSKDSTAHIGAFWTNGNVYTARENQGKALTLKATIDHFALTTRYESIFILDADTWLSPGHLSALEPHLMSDMAFVVGRIESQQEPWNFWAAYRGFVMWLYNAIIRTPQNALNVINVLPGSSVLISSETVSRIDWQRAASLVLDDFSMLCDVWHAGLGKIRYVHDTPSALVAEPLTFRAYLKQTYGRWWPGIWQTIRKRKMFFKTDWFSITNNIQMLNWVWSAVSPVLLIPACVVWSDMNWVWFILMMFAGHMAQMYIFAGIYAYQKRRPWALALLPAFMGMAYLESVLFTLAYFKSHRLKESGRWESPARVKKVKL